MLAKCRGRRAFSTLTFLLLMTDATVSAGAQTLDPYLRCSFYPQGTGCEQVYQRARHDTSPGAASVRNAFEHYVRYLKPENSGLTSDDKAYLAQSGIRYFDLDKGNLEGLHNVINDPALAQDAEGKRMEVNAFIARAVQAELYCWTNSCPEKEQPSS